MRSDWNARAAEDPYYYVAFGRRNQDQGEFLATASDVVRGLEAELKRLPANDRKNRSALEIGCGPGRLMLPMSWNFGEIHGVDVSDRMIWMAFRALHGIANAFPRQSSGTGLGAYGNDLFDFVYSYAVFQHIPSRDVVFNYLAEARRVMKTGGILRCQINGLPKTAKQCTTWEGVRLGAGEIAEFACEHDMQLLALEGADTQYMWTTMRKQPDGWFSGLTRPAELDARIRRIVSPVSGEPAVPARGRHASIAVWVENLPADCDLNQMNVLVDGEESPLVYVGPPQSDGTCQLNVMLPASVRTGLVPVELRWLGEPLCDEGWVRVVSPPPAVPCIVGVTDGINLMSGPRVSSPGRPVKLSIEDVASPENLTAAVDGHPVTDLDLFCVDPQIGRFEVNFHVPDTIGPGAHFLEVKLGARRLPPVEIEVAG